MCPAPQLPRHITTIPRDLCRCGAGTENRGTLRGNGVLRLLLPGAARSTHFWPEEGAPRFWPEQGAPFCLPRVPYTNIMDEGEGLCAQDSTGVQWHGKGLSQHRPQANKSWAASMRGTRGSCYHGWGRLSEARITHSARQQGASPI